MTNLFHSVDINNLCNLFNQKKRTYNHFVSTSPEATQQPLKPTKTLLPADQAKKLPHIFAKTHTLHYLYIKLNNLSQIISFYIK